MLKRTSRLTTTVALLAASHCAPRMPAATCPSHPTPTVPLEIATATASVVQLIEVEGKPRCSGVIVASHLVLSAAHCAVGRDGNGRMELFHVVLGGQRYDLTAAETGDFHPGEGKMQDWIVLQSAVAMANMTAATMAIPEELETIARRVSDSVADREIAVWSIGFPSRAVRLYPRQSIPGDGIFASLGYLKSARAYREALLMTAYHGVLYDDAMGLPPPRFADDVAQQWAGLAAGGDYTPEYDLFEKFRAAGNPLLYHSADYVPGSSGGGVFLGATGHLLGILPIGFSPVPRQVAFSFGGLYRIDAVCRASRVLALLPGCVALSRR